eukprot:scaffold33557_cov101-Isochrysis_galbana.AAC.3
MRPPGGAQAVANLSVASGRVSTIGLTSAAHNVGMSENVDGGQRPCWAPASTRERAGWSAAVAVLTQYIVLFFF